MKEFIDLAMDYIPRNNKNDSTPASGRESSMSNLSESLLNEFSGMFREAIDYLQYAEQQETARTEIRARRDVAIAALKERRQVISEYMSHVFQERAKVLQGHLNVLEKALSQNSPEMVSLALNGMVTVIKSSPFQDIKEMQKSLGNENFIIRLE